MDPTFDIVMRRDDFVLYSGEKPYTTQHRNEVAHSNARMLRFAITHRLAFEKPDITPLALLSGLVDVKAGSVPVFNANIDKIISDDPLFASNEAASLGFLFQRMDDMPVLIDFVFLNASSIASSLSNFLMGMEEGLSKTAFLLRCISELPVEQQVVLNTLMLAHGEGALVHLLLLSGYLSVTEYAAGLLVLKLKSCMETSSDDFFKTEKHLSETFQRYSDNALVALDFLTLCRSKNKISVIEEIIKQGEDNQTEFKSTLRWDIRQEKKNPAIEHAVLKTICAFLNSEGGDLLIGVRDDGSIEGIETDQFENDDKFLLHLWTLIKTCMGDEVVEWVKTSLQKFGGKTVCRVNCQKAAKPVFLNHKGFEEAFYVRVGPSSSNLEISSALKYIQQHF